MNKKLLYTSVLFVLWGISPLMAQTFAPGSSVSTGNGSYARPAKPQARTADIKAEKPQNRVNTAQTEPQQSGSDELLNSAETNNEKPKEAEYDNSEGKVIEFKFVDGKIVFGNDEDRKILVWYEDYKVERGMDNMVRCSMRIYVLNDMKDRLNNLSFKLKWPEISTNVQMVRVNPGVKTYTDTMLLGNGCLSMDKTPTIEVNRCRVKGKTEEQCADAVKWFQKNQ